MATPERAHVSGEPPTATRIGNGVYRVEYGGRNEIVYVAGAPEDRWAFWNGRVFRSGVADRMPPDAQMLHGTVPQAIAAPMPATVLKLFVEPGSKVKKGETVLILEAMKMELPIRASRDGIVTSVRCHEGQLVQPDTVLVELAPPVSN
jgi:biotin carboxyl carrier protein